MDEYPKEEWPQHAFFLGLAALLGDGIYNIGELVSNEPQLDHFHLNNNFSLQLAHPILESLKDTENAWVVDLLKAFNSGDIKK